MKKNNVDTPETVNVYSLIAEYVGMFIFITIVLMHSENPIAIGIGLTAVIFCFGNISGGHFNPAVTFFKYLQGDIAQMKTVYYIAAQYSASILIFLLHKL